MHPDDHRSVQQRGRLQTDSAEFLDPAAAEKVLAPIADQVAADSLTVTLTGTTADYGIEKGQKKLSKERAQAVADELVQHGVAPAQLLGVQGLGSDFPGYVDDRDDNGVLIPAAAAQNRKV